jgi:hypothetical protein
MSSYEPTKRTVRVPRTGALWVFLIAVVLAEVAALIARAQGVHVPPPAFWWPLYALGPVIAWSSMPRQKRTGSVRVFDSGVTLDGATLARREELELGLVRREGDTTWLRLRAKSRWLPKMLDVAVDDAAEAERILALLGLDAKSRTTDFTLFVDGGDKLAALVVAVGFAAAIAAIGVLVALRSIGPLGSVAGLIAVVVVVAGALVAFLRSRRAKLTVGVDGLRIAQGFDAPRFVPHDRIREANAHEGKLTVRLTDGTELVWRAQERRRKKGPYAGEDQKLAEAIVEKLHAARAAFQDLGGDVGNVPALARARRSTSEWLDAL